jgi:hypothetical protein
MTSGIMYDDADDRIILTTHSKPGTATARGASSSITSGRARCK